MKTVAFFIDNLTRSGTELQVKGLIEHLPESINPILITIKPSDPELIPSNCHHVYIPLPKLLSMHGVKQIAAITKLLKKHKVDVVQCYFQDATIVGLIAAIAANIQLKIVCFRDLGFWITQPHKILLRVLYAFANRFIVNADIVARFFSTQFRLPMNKFTVIRNGIDAHQLPFNPLRPPTRVAIVGNMTRQVKRIDLFISAAALLKKTYPNLSWHVIGDGHLKAELHQQADELNVSDKVIFAGRISDIPQYLQAIDIGVICSDSEGLSNAIIEYMFSGVTVVATRVGGNPELIEQGSTGWLVEPNDAAALANAIAYFIEHPEERAACTYKARAFVETHYSWERCVEQHLRLYEQSLPSQPR